MKFNIVLPLAANFSNHTNHVTKKCVPRQDGQSDKKTEQLSVMKSVTTMDPTAPTYLPHKKVLNHKTNKYVPQYSNIYIEGIASGASLDLDGEEMLKSAIDSMNKSFHNDFDEDNPLPLRQIHDIEYTGIAGVVIEASVVTDDNNIYSFAYKAVLNNPEVDPTAQKLLFAINSGILLGVSITGDVKKVNFDVPDPSKPCIVSNVKYVEVTLDEISTTQFPAYALSTLDFAKTLKKARENNLSFNDIPMKVTKDTETVKDEKDIDTKADQPSIEEAPDAETPKTEPIKPETPEEKTIAPLEQDSTPNKQENGDVKIPEQPKEPESQPDNGLGDKVKKGVVQDNIHESTKKRRLFQPIIDIVNAAEDAFVWSTSPEKEQFSEIKKEVVDLMSALPDDFDAISGLSDVYKTIKFISKDKKELDTDNVNKDLQKAVKKLTEEIGVLKSSEYGRTPLSDNEDVKETKLFNNLHKSFGDAKNYAEQSIGEQTTRAAYLMNAKRFFS